MKKLILLLILILTTTLADAEIVGGDVDYKDADVALQGYVAYDNVNDDLRPGILVVHDWMGMGDYPKKRANMLAREGYVAFAVDIYGKDVRPQNREEASAQATKFKSNRALLRERVKTGLDILKKNPLVDPDKIAVIGYCFGGTTALELARSGADIAGAVSFHGGLDSPTPEDAKNIKAKVLVLHGADDPYVPAEEVAAFQKEMKDADVDMQMISYSDAVHAFTQEHVGTDKSSGAAYNAQADRDSWEAMKEFFGEIFN